MCKVRSFAKLEMPGKNLVFHDHPLFSITFSLCSGEKQYTVVSCQSSVLSQTDLGLARTPDQDRGYKLTEVRLRRIADVQ